MKLLHHIDCPRICWILDIPIKKSYPQDQHEDIRLYLKYNCVVDFMCAVQEVFEPNV